MSGRISVVVYDDVPELRKLARLALEQDDDVEVTGEAADGREAIEVVRRLQPDVVVLDLSMPEMDGLEAIPLLRGRAGNRIVIFSRFEEGKVAELALRLKAELYVRKGAPLDELRSAVRELAQRAA